ncbi:MAG: hypothetical protein MZW92_42870 [Comamonadaceae bacterium]|nr:hypothetical protein [Comamonadaceae bacterium]
MRKRRQEERLAERQRCGPSRSGSTRSRRPTSACAPRPTSSRRVRRRSSNLPVPA